MTASTGFTFERVPALINFPDIEREILEFWKANDIFKRSLKMSLGKKPFSFYDGPPFATGHPHYGHILAGTIKDVVTRFAHQTGHYVERRFGWDTHGLPVEFEIDTKLGIKSREDVLAMGIDKYNAACREIVLRYSKEWEETVQRCGRWVDFDGGYRTMDLDYMESVWWVFKTVFDKNLIYRGSKVMPYSCRLGTPLSNFEANLNYKDVTDPSIIVKFPLKNGSGDFADARLLAWTTTPWTLPSHLAICVRGDMVYRIIRDIASGEKWIIGASRLEELYKKPKEGKDYELVKSLSGADLVGMEYDPPFDYFEDRRKDGAFRVVSDDYVTDKSGTGLVHQAPGFGEDDFRICLHYKIIRKGDEVVCPIDANGHFTAQVPDLQTLHFLDANRPVARALRSRNLLARESQCRHSYPFCWRSDTPLMYRAVPSWFLNVESLKARLVARTAETRWVPGHVQEKRFANWLGDARDWAISRSRFWGTPLPVWSDGEFAEVVVVGSVAELEALSGVRGIRDLHRETIDKIKIPSKNGPHMLTRIDEVFDCWFESGSMPYAQQHYPFENKDKFLSTFPADFVAEGLDQTRGWFYTLMVLSTALFDKPAFKNLICNGLILSEDGKKMSKRLKNYPSPTEILDEFGADALRICLINSPAVRAEPLKFSKTGVSDVVKKVLILWFNTYRFFVENTIRYETEHKAKFHGNAEIYKETENKLDLWIYSSLMSLVEEVRADMAAYELYKVTPALIRFLGHLSLWYVRLNRERMKGIFGAAEAKKSLQTLHFVLYSLCRLMAPFTPFIVEKFYQNLKNGFGQNSESDKDSVHFLEIPEINSEARNDAIEASIARFQEVVELGRQARESRALKYKQPLESMIVLNNKEEYIKDVSQFENFIKKDLNIENVVFSSKTQDYTTLKCVPNRKSLGLRLRNKAPGVIKAVLELGIADIQKIQKSGEVSVTDEVVYAEDVDIELTLLNKSERYCSAMSNGVCVILDTNITPELREKCRRREIISFVQKFKKKLNLNPSVSPFVVVKADGELGKSVQSDSTNKNAVSVIGSSLLPFDLYKEMGLAAHLYEIGRVTDQIDSEKIEIILLRTGVIFSKRFLAQKENDKAKKMAFEYCISKSYDSFVKEQNENGGFIDIYGENGHISARLQRGADYFLSVEELLTNKE